MPTYHNYAYLGLPGDVCVPICTPVWPAFTSTTSMISLHISFTFIVNVFFHHPSFSWGNYLLCNVSLDSLCAPSSLHTPSSLAAPRHIIIVSYQVIFFSFMECSVCTVLYSVTNCPNLLIFRHQ